MDEGSQKAKSMFIKLALVVIILLTLLCVGIFLLISRADTGIFSRTNDKINPSTTPVVGLTPTIFELPKVWMNYIERGYLYKFDYLSDWEIDHESEIDDVVFTARDGSSMGISSNKTNYENIGDYLLAIDIERALENSGNPSVIVEWSNNYNIDKTTEVIRRKEKQVDENIVIIRNYLLKEDYIFTFSTYSLSNDTAESNEMFRESLNLIGTFEFKTDRFEAEGIVVTGEGIGKPQCPDGNYLNIDGTYLRKGDKALLLRSISPGVGNEYPLFKENSYLGKAVNINAIYDTKKKLCTGLSCDCEDYLLIESIE